jgi:hypothetical protein
MLRGIVGAKKFKRVLPDKFLLAWFDGFRPMRLLFAALLLAVSLSSELAAQTTTSGGLIGVVTDPSGAVVLDADVEIKNNSKVTTQSMKTDREGVYRFFFLAPARYTLTVSHDGFRTENRAVNVLLGPAVSVNVTLQIPKATASVSVTAEAPLIHAENGDVSTTMNQKQISELPNPGNDLTYIAQTAPGTVMNTDGGYGFSILGMPSSSYLFTIDGLNNNENGENTAAGGLLGLLLGQNQIQEATVVTTGYAGQFGGAAGGNINYITKSGSNQFHGNAQYYWNGRVLNANDWFSNTLGNPRPFDIANQWAGSLGGPIKKDKLFFFFDTEGLRLFFPQPSVVLIPSLQFETATIANIDSDPRFGPNSATDAFYKKIFNLYNAAPGASSAIPGGVSSSDPTGCSGFIDPNNPKGLGTTLPCARYFLATRGRASQETLTAGRVDWTVSRIDRASLRLQYDVARSARYTDPINSVFDTDASGPWWQGQIIETHTFGSSAASQFLLAGSYRDGIQQVKNPSRALSAFPTTLSFGAQNTPNAFATLGGADNAYIFGFSRADTQYQLSEDVVKTRGKHKFGFGANFVRIHWSILSNKVNATGYLAPQTLDALYYGGVDPTVPPNTDPNPNVTQLAQSFAAGAFRLAFYELGLYGQDEWQARPNLTLTLSLRAEHQSNPVCASRCFTWLAGPFESISHDPAQPYNQAILITPQGLPGIEGIVWSPRVSFAWQPLGVAHSSVLRGGFGIFYDPIAGYTATPTGPPIYNGYTISGYSLTPNEKTSLFKEAAASNAAFVNGFAAGQTLAQIKAADPNFFPPGASGWEGKAHLPQYQRWSLEWQQGLGAGTSLSVGYYGHHGIHELVENPNVNAWGFGSLPTGRCTSPPVPPCADPRFSQVSENASVAVSNYNGMVVSFQHRFSRWSQGLFQFNYTYGHAFDEVSNGGDFSFTSGTDSQNPQDPKNLRGAYGPAEYDVRHSFNANYVWELPLKAALGGHGPDSLVKGWQVSGTIFAHTGYPETIFDFAESQNLQQNNYFGLLYAVPVSPLGRAPSCGAGAAIPLAPRPCQPPQLLPNGNPNPNALFVQSGCETGFNAGHLGASGVCNGPLVSFVQRRNQFRGPSYFNTDFAIMKNTRVPGWENAMLGIGFQFFNVFNHPSFSPWDNFMSNSTFGQIGFLEGPPTGILGTGSTARMIQLKAQLQF